MLKTKKLKKKGSKSEQEVWKAEERKEREGSSREERFPCHIIQAHGLELARHIGIDHVLSHSLVVLDVVFLNERVFELKKWNDEGKVNSRSPPPSHAIYSPNSP